MRFALQVGMALLTVAAPWAQPKYVMTDLGVLPGGVYSNATSINQAGTIVGWSGTSPDVLSDRAVIWQPGEVQPTLLTGLPPSRSIALDINSRGSVVGYREDIVRRARAFLLTRGTSQDLGIEGSAASINNHDQIVGMTDGPPQRGFLWGGGKLTFIETLGGISNSAWDINDRGEIVGQSQTPDGLARGFVISGGKIQAIGTLGGRYSAATAINNSGQIVGSADLADYPRQHAFLFGKGLMKDLGTLGGACSYAADINDSGDVVGWSYATDGAGRAFIWTNGTMYDLNTLIVGGTAWILQTASKINTRGQIVGYAFDEQHNQGHGYLLTPIRLGFRR